MPFNKGKFTKPGAIKSTGEKGPSEARPSSTGAKETQPAHGDGGEKHVTETHPGQTQPHPTTGVHAIQAMHVGGGKYKSHTHHDGGEVETRHHEEENGMHQAMKEALPPAENNGESQQDDHDGGMPFGEVLGGVGGGMQHE